jgi:hypothetical protein
VKRGQNLRVILATDDRQEDPDRIQGDRNFNWINRGIVAGDAQLAGMNAREAC